MPGKRRIRAISLDPDLDDMLVALAAAEMGENVSKMIRKLLRDHLGMNDEGVSSVSGVVADPKPVKDRQYAPRASPSEPLPVEASFVEPAKPARKAKESDPMPDSSDKLAYGRWIKRNSR